MKKYLLLLKKQIILDYYGYIFIVFSFLLTACGGKSAESPIKSDVKVVKLSANKYYGDNLENNQKDVHQYSYDETTGKLKSYHSVMGTVETLTTFQYNNVGRLTRVEQDYINTDRVSTIMEFSIATDTVYCILLSIAYPGYNFPDTVRKAIIDDEGRTKTTISKTQITNTFYAPDGSVDSYYYYSITDSANNNGLTRAEYGDLKSTSEVYKDFNIHEMTTILTVSTQLPFMSNTRNLTLLKEEGAFSQSINFIADSSGYPTEVDHLLTVYDESGNVIINNKGKDFYHYTFDTVYYK